MNQKAGNPLKHANIKLHIKYYLQHESTLINYLIHVGFMDHFIAKRVGGPGMGAECQKVRKMLQNINESIDKYIFYERMFILLFFLILKRFLQE